jgi:chemotaxis signal transduction protein
LEWLTFKIGEEIFTIETRFIYRVVDELKIAPVPLMPECYLGLAYYRGELFDIIHLNTLLMGVAVHPARKGRVMLMKWPGRHLGLMVEEIKDFSWAEAPAALESPATRENGPPMPITPQYLWDRLMGLEYGRREV